MSEKFLQSFNQCLSIRSRNSVNSYVSTPDTERRISFLCQKKRSMECLASCPIPLLWKPYSLTLPICGIYQTMRACASLSQDVSSKDMVLQLLQSKYSL